MKRLDLNRRLPLLLFFPAAVWAADPPAPAPLPPASSPAKAEALPQNSALYDLLREIETLKAEIARLRGQAEMQAHQIESLGKRQSDLYVDLDKRVEEMGKQIRSAPAASSPAVANPTAAANPQSESQAYEAALDQFKAGEYAKAIAGFGDFLKAHPGSTLAPNAQYWTGYAYYAMKDYRNAIAQQTKLLNAYPQNAKAPDALLNIASSQAELKETAAAKKNLEEVIAKYPGTNAAAIAAKRLALLK